MEAIRPTAVAGLFYPASSQALLDMIEKNLQQVELPANFKLPKALIVPHAGYIYSAPIAASAYTLLQAYRQQIKRVVLIGPSHRVSFNGLALCSADFFSTPLGQIAIDKTAQSQISSIEGVGLLDQAHADEHSLEVQLPFLQFILDDFTIVPIVAGNASPKLVEKLINSLWGGPETLVVISSDLSHYHDYRSAQQLDRNTSQSIVDLDIDAVDSQHACGCVGIRGLLSFAQHHPLNVSILDVRNSGDTAGDKDRVVGYGAYCFTEVA